MPQQNPTAEPPSEHTQKPATTVFLIVSLMLLPGLYISGLTSDAVGKGIYVYLIFMVISWRFLHKRPAFQMLKAFGLAPIAFCILITPVYFVYYVFNKDLVENAYSIMHVIHDWGREVIMQSLVIGYMHVFAVFIIYVFFYVFAGIKRTD